jgi:peptidoglycan/LPS O-acetylase OafA/YrhL
MKQLITLALLALVLLSSCATAYVEGPRQRTYNQWVRYYKKRQRAARRNPIPVAGERYERPRR